MKQIFYNLAVLSGALAIPCGAALAFQETEVPVTAPERHADPSLNSETGKSLGLSGVEDDLSSSKDRSLYIPGIGSFKNLPALDFGLELLYEDDDVNPIEQDDSMGIKGQLKHKF